MPNCRNRPFPIQYHCMIRIDTTGRFKIVGIDGSISMGLVRSNLRIPWLFNQSKSKSQETEMTQASRMMRASAIFVFVLTLLGFQASVLAGSADGSGGVTFGDKPTFQSTDKFSYALSPDKKAFTLLFEGLEAEVANGGDPPPVISRVPPIVLPFTGQKNLR